MESVLLSVHILIAVLLIVSVLIQQTSQSGFGLGGAPSSANDLARLLEGRGASNFLSNSTAILGILFFTTSISLALLSGAGRQGTLLGNVFGTGYSGETQGLVDQAIQQSVEEADAAAAAQAGVETLGN